MTVSWRCLVLCLLVACGSKSGTSGEAKPAEAPPTKAPAAAKPVAVAFVFEGWEMWAGNDDIEPPEGDPVMGALKPFKESFKRASLKELPAGSKAAVISYGERAIVRRPMGPIATLTAEDFGTQKDYARVIERNLVEGVRVGLDELARVNDARRILVVIGDGSDMNVGQAKAELTKLAERASAEGVELVSIVYQAQRSPPYSMIGSLDPSYVRVNTVEAIVDQLNWSFVRLAEPPVAPSGGPPPFTLALLMSGAEVWLGNDDFTPETDPSRYLGALNAIRAGFERAPLTGFPDGSQAMLVTYESKVRMKVPLMPIAKFDVRALGVQRDYLGQLGSELVGGVRLALTELAKLKGGRRVLVILGDGTDTDNDAAKSQLKALAKQAADLKIEIYAIVYKGPLSEPTTVVTELDPKATIATTADEITADLVALFRVLHNH